MSNINVPLSKINVKDPLIAEWILQRLKDISQVDTVEAGNIKDQLFNDISIKYLLEYADADLLIQLFSQIDADRFENNLGTLISKWPQWNGNAVTWSTSIIAKLNPEKAFMLFLSYFESVKSSKSSDMKKIFGIFDSIEYLKDEDAKNISEILINDYLKHTVSKTGKFFFLPKVLKIAWKYEHPEFNKLLYSFIEDFPKNDPFSYRKNMEMLCLLFAGSKSDCSFICDICNGWTKQKYTFFSKFFTVPGLLPGIDNAVKMIQKHDYKIIHNLFLKNSDLISSFKVKKILLDLLNDKDLINRLNKKEKSPLFYAFILGCLVTSIRADTIDLNELPLKEVIHLLLFNIEDMPFPDTFINYLKQQNKENVIKYLIDALQSNLNNYGGKHIIEVMGELGYDEFLLPLIKILSEDTEYIYLAAEKSLLKYNDKSVDYIEENFKEMSDFALMTVLNMFEKIGGPKVIQFLDKHFDELWRNLKEHVLYLIEAVVDERFIKRLAPKVNKGQFLIDKTYIVLNKLFGYTSPEIDALEKKLNEYEKEIKEMGKSFEEGQVLKTVKPYINLELKCNNCGDISYYRVNNIIVDPSQKSELYIAEEITCVNCDKISEFSVTSGGMMAMTAELLRMEMLKTDEERQEVLERSPINFVSSTVKGKKMGIKEGIQNYQAAIKKYPDDPENYIGLGNIYKNMNQYFKAEEYYKKALEIDPSYIEIYFCLAHIARMGKDYETAVKWIEKGNTYMGRAKYRKHLEKGIDEFNQEYAGLYNELVKHSENHKILLHPGAVRKKIGRNAPCPCGSGKKYKKCCLGKVPLS